MLQHFPTVWHSSTRRADKSYFSQLTDWRTPVVVLLRLLQQSNPIARSRKLKGSWFKDSLLYFPHCQAKQLSFIVWLYQKTFWRKANLVSSQEPWGNFYVNQDAFKISIEPPSQMLSSEFVNHALQLIRHVFH